MKREKVDVLKISLVEIVHSHFPNLINVNIKKRI